MMSLFNTLPILCLSFYEMPNYYVKCRGNVWRNCIINFFFWKFFLEITRYYIEFLDIMKNAMIVTNRHKHR